LGWTLVDIEANLTTYLGARVPTDRYASFDYCFNYFRARREEGRITDLAQGVELQMACLQLGFYLASWGMYRGSTELLKRSLRHLEQPVAVIASSPREVWDCDANDYSDEVCTLLLRVGARLRSVLPGATDTLVTKVMLGVFGCIPALDDNFVTGFRRAGYPISGFNRPVLKRIERFYDENAKVIERHRVPTLDFETGSDTRRVYSRAKVIDMIFFVEGERRSSPSRRRSG
jgi:hypothetical protein